MKIIAKSFFIFLTISFFTVVLMGMASKDKNTAVSIQSTPIRPTPLPTPTTTATPVSIPGGWLVLQVEETAVTDELWTRVEWQDSTTGLWHQVDGWKGHFHNSNQISWYVAPDNFNEGPFRWKIYTDESESTLIATSDTFSLPNERWHKVIIEVSLE